MYGSAESDQESGMTVSYRRYSDIDSSASIRTVVDKDLESYFEVKYASVSDVESTVEAVSVYDVEGHFEIRVHNRMLGNFQLLPPPRTTVRLPPLEDATTRSRIDLQTINYGDTQRMIVGNSEHESFESFINFGDLDKIIPDLLRLEKAKMRLYYTGTFTHPIIELQQPRSLWREKGITHANKPSGVELLNNEYTVNYAEKYIEFDLKPIMLRWQKGELINYGLLIHSSSDSPTYFNTRESDKPPILEVTYITNKIYSSGRTDIESNVFIYGAGRKDIPSTLTVQSSVGINEHDASLYVHQPKDFMLDEKTSSLSISKPTIGATLKVTYAKQIDIESEVAVSVFGESPKEVVMAVSKPDSVGHLTVDPRMSVESCLIVTRIAENTVPAELLISRPSLGGSLEVSKYTRANCDFEASFTLQRGEEKFYLSEVTVSRPDLQGQAIIRAYGESSIHSAVDIPYYHDQASKVSISRPETIGFIEVAHFKELEGHLYVKERVYTEGLVDIRQINDLPAILTTNVTYNKESELIINKPELGGYFYPRLIGEDNFESLTSIRKRDVSDWESTLIIKSMNNSYWYIL